MEMDEEVLEMEDMPSASADENASGQANTLASPVHADVTPQSEENNVQLPVLRDQNDSNIASRITLRRTEIPDSAAFSELSGLAEFTANLSPPGTSHVNYANPPDQAIEISNEDPELQELGTFVLNGEVREPGSISGLRLDAEFPALEESEQPEALSSNTAAIQVYEGLAVDVDNTELENIPEFKMMESEESQKQAMKVDLVSVDLQKDYSVDLHVASNTSDVASLDVERAVLEVKTSTQDGDMERELGKYTLKPGETIACLNEQRCDEIHQAAGIGEGNLENLQKSNVLTISIPEDLMDGMEDHTIIEDTHATNSEKPSQRQIESTGNPVIRLETSPNRASEISTLCEKASVLEDGVTMEHSQENGDEGRCTNAINTYIEPAVETESSVPAEFMLVDDISNNALPPPSKAVVEEFSTFPVLVRAQSPLPQGDVQMLDNDADQGEVSEESFIRAMATSSVEAPPSTHSRTQNEHCHAAMEVQPEEKTSVIKMAPNSLGSSVTVQEEDPETLAEPRPREDVLMLDAIADHVAAFKDDFHITADAKAQEEIKSLRLAVVEEKFVIPDSEDESMPNSSAPNSEIDDVETVNAIPVNTLKHAPILEAMHAQTTVLVAADILGPTHSADNDIPMIEASITQQKGGAAEVEACVDDAQETFVTASEEKVEARTSQKHVIQDSGDEDEASEELEQSPMLPSAYQKSSEIASEPTDNLKAPAAEPVIVESKEALFIGMLSSSPRVEVAVPPLQKTRPKTPNTSFKLPTINKEKQSQMSGIQSSPVKSEVSNSSPSKPTQALEATEGPQLEDPVMRELITMKIASIKARNAALTAEIEKKRAKLDEISKDLTQPAAETVKTHIKLLHDYNDIKDVGQALIGMIADNRGVRIGELYKEFGVDLKD